MSTNAVLQSSLDLKRRIGICHLSTKVSIVALRVGVIKLTKIPRSVAILPARKAKGKRGKGMSKPVEALIPSPVSRSLASAPYTFTFSLI
jgi:hypothetical protein